MLNTYMLIGLAAASIPILIELLFRMRRKHIEFPAMRYLMNPHKRKRVRLQDRILLLIRMAVLALLAVALARPLLRPSAEAAGDAPKRNVVIVLDGTYSMGQSVGQTTAFEVAQTMGQDVVRGLPKDASISVVSLGHRAEVSLEKIADGDRVHDWLGRAQVSDMSGRMPDAIEAVEKLIAESDGLPPEIFLISDLQRSTWLPTPDDNRDAMAMLAKLSERCDAYVLDTGGRSGFNAYVTRFEPEDKVMAVGMVSEFVVEIEANNMPQESTLLVTLLADAEGTTTTATPAAGGGSSEPRKIATKELTVTDLEDGRARVRFRYTFVEPGEHLLRVQLEGDRLATDNQQYYLATVPRNVEVLVIDPSATSTAGAAGSPSTTEPLAAKFLRDAIAPVTPPGFDRLSRYAVTVNNTSNVLERNFDDFAVIVMVNVGNLPDALTKRLSQYVTDGGRLMIFLGDAVIPYEYNAKLLEEGRGLLPCELGDAEGLSPSEAVAQSSEEKDGAEGPLLSLVYGGLGGDPHPAVARVRQMVKKAAPPSISRYIPLKLGNKKTQFGRPIAYLSNKQPAICEREFGQGKVVVVNTSADGSWNFLPYNSEYAVLMQQLLGWMIGDPDGSVNLHVGDKFEEPVLLSSQYLLLRKPDYSKVRIAPTEASEGEVWNISYGDTARQGLYKVDTIPEVLKRRRFVVNMAATEGDLARLDATDLADQVSEVGGDYWGPETAITRQVESRYSVTEFAWMFLWIVFGLLAAETFLATRFGQRRI